MYLRLQHVVCRWPRDQSAFAGVDGSGSADGTAVQDGTVGGVAHMLDMPRERVERGVSVRTQRVLKMCGVADPVSHVSEADTEQDQSVYVMIASQPRCLVSAAFLLVYFARLYSFVQYSFLRVVLTVGTCEASRFDSISNRTSDSGFDS